MMKHAIIEMLPVYVLSFVANLVSAIVILCYGMPYSGQWEFFYKRVIFVIFSLVKRYNNNSEFDSDVYFGESKDKMYMILGNLEFDELVSVPDYVREEIGKDDALDMTNDRSLSL